MKASAQKADALKKRKFRLLKKEMLILPQKKCRPPPKKNGPQKRNYSPINFFSLHGNGDTVRMGQEIPCLPYKEIFFIPLFFFFDNFFNFWIF